MILRVIAVVWTFALLAGLAFHFSDQIFVLLDSALKYNEDERKRVLDLLEITGNGLGIVGGVLTFFAAAWHFMVGKGQSKSESSGSTTTTNFMGSTSAGRDLVVGNKTVSGGKDAG